MMIVFQNLQLRRVQKCPFALVYSSGTVLTVWDKSGHFTTYFESISTKYIYKSTSDHIERWQNLKSICSPWVNKKCIGNIKTLCNCFITIKLSIWNFSYWRYDIAQISNLSTKYKISQYSKCRYPSSFDGFFFENVYMKFHYDRKSRHIDALMN